MDNILKDRNAVVVGGTSSVGLKVSQLLLSCGAVVTVTGRTFNKTLYGAFQDNVHFIPLDFEKDFDGSLDNADFVKALSSADVLVVCYGPFVQKSIEETDASDWKNMALLDYALPGILVSRTLPGMNRRNSGRIILFGGTRTESVRGFVSNAAYAGAKTGVSVLVKSVAMECASTNVTCNGICPGFTRNAPEGTYCVSSVDLAKKVKFFVESPEVNGVVLNVDRGWNP